MYTALHRQQTANNARHVYILRVGAHAERALGSTARLGFLPFRLSACAARYVHEIMLQDARAIATNCQ